MNFLAHFYLSGNSEPLLVGNLIGDAVKGRSLVAFSEPVQQGIRMHRAIDYFTDTHPAVSRSKDRLRSKFNHYSGVITDVFYDHILARNWSDYSDEPLAQYSQRIYGLLERHWLIFPPRIQFMFPYMKQNNWLLGYADVQGIHRALSGMAKRTAFVSHMEEAAQFLERDYLLYKQDFEIFFPSLVEHTRVFREEYL
ncbi:MAG: ACP phosphodiesterase [Bacteroidota bacterium]